jgi:hypothetical protein
VIRLVAGAGAPPTFTAGTRAVSFADAEAILALVRRAEGDLDRYPEGARAHVEQFVAELQAMVSAGEAAFDSDDASAVVAGTAALAELWTEGDCDDLVT